ncbi:MAG: CSLREA domain-containing protein [Chloroflexota bacterium]
MPDRFYLKIIGGVYSLHSPSKITTMVVATLINLLIIGLFSQQSVVTALPTLTPISINTIVPSQLQNMSTAFFTPIPSNRTLIVTKLTDTNDGSCDAQDCSLREAVTQADWGTTIKFAETLKGTIALDKEIHIRVSISIVGNGTHSTDLTIEGQNKNKTSMFWIEGDNLPGLSVSLTNITLANGTSISGGAIINEKGIMFLNDCTFRNNAATVGGVITNNFGKVIIANSTFIHNNASYGAVIVNNSGEVSIINSTFYENGDSSIANTAGTIKIVNSTFQNKDAEVIENLGGLANSKNTVSIKNSVIVANTKTSYLCKGPVTDNGGDLQFPTKDCGATIPVKDPKLGSLFDDGSFTEKINLEPESPAINGTMCDSENLLALLKTPQADQLTTPFPCNIGAYQVKGTFGN